MGYEYYDRITNDPWMCPECGSTELWVTYTERRVCAVGTYIGQPWPTYAGDEFVELDEGAFRFWCRDCDAEDIRPLPAGQGEG